MNILNNISLILLLLTYIGGSHCVAQVRTPEDIALYMDSVRTAPIQFREVYEISKGIFSWYPGGYVQFENYTMFRDEDGNTFLVMDYDGKNEPTAVNILDRKDVCIVHRELTDIWSIYMSWHELYQFEKIIPDSCTAIISGYNTMLIKEGKAGLKQIKYIIEPVGFLLFIMTGKAYNHITFDICGDLPIDKPMTFPDDNAYYRVLMPLWRKAR